MTLAFFTSVVVFLSECLFIGKYSIFDMIVISTIVVSLYNIVMLLLPERMA